MISFVSVHAVGLDVRAAALNGRNFQMLKLPNAEGEVKQIKLSLPENSVIHGPYRIFGHRSYPRLRNLPLEVLAAP